MSIEHDTHGHARFSFSVPETIGLATGALAIMSAASLWMSLPHRVDAAEEANRSQDVHIAALTEASNSRNEKVAALVAVVESIDKRTQRIENSLSIR